MHCPQWHCASQSNTMSTAFLVACVTYLRGVTSIWNLRYGLNIYKKKDPLLCALILLLANDVWSSFSPYVHSEAFFKIVWQFKHGCFPIFFFCRPLTLGECYTGQPACSIRPANHALAYICLYPCPLPFRKAPLRVALFKLNHRLLRFWAAIHSAHHCLLLVSSIIFLCAS